LSPEEDYDAHTERVTAVAGATIEHFEVGDGSERERDQRVASRGGPSKRYLCAFAFEKQKHGFIFSIKKRD
jgi:hypothetical protein